MRLLFLLALGAIGAWIVRGWVFEGIVIASASMDPTLPVGRHVFVNKLAYKAAGPKRGDIILFPSPVEHKDLVKRVIAVEGEEVRIEKKKIFVNGVELTEPYAVHRRGDERLVGDNLEVGRVPKGKIFVLGDNRDHSGDSRDWIDPKTKEHRFFVDVHKVKGKLVDAE